jgi:hypothetical protein
LALVVLELLEITLEIVATTLYLAPLHLPVAAVVVNLTLMAKTAALAAVVAAFL